MHLLKHYSEEYLQKKYSRLLHEQVNKISDKRLSLSFHDKIIMQNYRKKSKENLWT